MEHRKHSACIQQVDFHATSTKTCTLLMIEAKLMLKYYNNTSHLLDLKTCYTDNCCHVKCNGKTSLMFRKYIVHIKDCKLILLRSKSTSGKCAELHTVGARNDKDHIL